MSTRYQVLFRRRPAPRPLRLRLAANGPTVTPEIAPHDELPAEQIDLATGQLVERRRRPRGRK